MMRRVLSGMRPTGELHLGHLCGVLQNWRKLQTEAECFFFVADWHALTTNRAAPDLQETAENMVAAWLAAGVDGGRAAMFVQSDVAEHGELHILLSMLCSVPELTRMPTYNEMKKENADDAEQDWNNYGFLGYPVLQSADILAYRPYAVPVGEDQKPHIEFTRDLAHRVNTLYGDGGEKALSVLPAAQQNKIRQWRNAYQQNGESGGLEELLAEIKDEDKSFFRNYCLRGTEEILPLPEVLLTPAARLVGTDGERKMSKSFGNTVDLFDSAETVNKKIAPMKTDPARQRRTDAGDPEKCPVWSWHKQFSDAETQQWAADGCRSAGIGCLDCKKKLAAHINETLQPIRDKEIEKKKIVKDVLADGTRRARAVAGETLARVRRAMGLKKKMELPQ